MGVSRRLKGLFESNTETKRLRQILQERYKKLMGDKKPLDVKDKILIIVDDGIATGYTLKVAIALLREKKPKKIVVAVPVAPSDSAIEIKDLVDDFICLQTPKLLFSINAFYDDFAPVTDKESAKWIQEFGG